MKCLLFVSNTENTSYVWQTCTFLGLFIMFDTEMQSVVIYTGAWGMNEKKTHLTSLFTDNNMENFN